MSFPLDGNENSRMETIVLECIFGGIIFFLFWRVEILGGKLRFLLLAIICPVIRLDVMYGEHGVRVVITSKA